MRATAKCPVCKKELETECPGCIDMNEAPHFCKKGMKTVKVGWKVIKEDDEKDSL